jgi:hypothetical protein
MTRDRRCVREGDARKHRFLVLAGGKGRALCLLPILVLGCAAPRSEPGTTPGGTVPAAGRSVERESWPDGSPRLRAEVRIEPDGSTTLDGDYALWYADGQKQYEATYRDGRLHGTERQWHENGRLRVEQQYEDGLREGPRYDWDPAGRLRKEERYHRDRPHGTWSVWDGEGKLKWQGRFEHGKPLS